MTIGTKHSQKKCVLRAPDTACVHEERHSPVYFRLAWGMLLTVTGCTHNIESGATSTQSLNGNAEDCVSNERLEKSDNLKWNQYKNGLFDDAKEVKVFEINKPGMIGPGITNRELLVSLKNKVDIEELISVLVIDEERSGKYRSACVPYVLLEIIENDQNKKSIIVFNGSIVPETEGGLYLTDHSICRFKQWFMTEIGRLPYDWDRGGCGEQ